MPSIPHSKHLLKLFDVFILAYIKQGLLITYCVGGRVEWIIDTTYGLESKLFCNSCLGSNLYDLTLKEQWHFVQMTPQLTPFMIKCLIHSSDTDNNTNCISLSYDYNYATTHFDYSDCMHIKGEGQTLFMCEHG